jgi:CheY-like chemotaxis protein
VLDQQRIALKELQQMNVFVVDDEVVIAETLATILRISGFVATSFTSPLDALNLTRTMVPDLLITDVVMPEMSGIELAIKIKSLCPDCKVLLFSGQAATADLLSAARAEGHEFEILSKPVHPKDLLNRLKSLKVKPSFDSAGDSESASPKYGAA